MFLAIINLTFSEGDFMSPDASASSKRSHAKKLRSKHPDKEDGNGEKEEGHKEEQGVKEKPR